jgi:hypothetical protein
MQEKSETPLTPQKSDQICSNPGFSFDSGASRKGTGSPSTPWRLGEASFA